MDEGVSLLVNIIAGPEKDKGRDGAALAGAAQPAAALGMGDDSRYRWGGRCGGREGPREWARMGRVEGLAGARRGLGCQPKGHQPCSFLRSDRACFCPGQPPTLASVQAQPSRPPCPGIPSYADCLLPTICFHC